MNVQLSSALKTKFSEEKKGNMIHWILNITTNKTSENDVVSLYEPFTHSPPEIITQYQKLEQDPWNPLTISQKKSTYSFGSLQQQWKEI